MQNSTTFKEASVFADFLLHLITSSFTAVMELPEITEYSDWSPSRMSRLLLLYTCNCHQYQGKVAMFVLLSKINHTCKVQYNDDDDDTGGANTVCLVYSCVMYVRARLCDCLLPAWGVRRRRTLA